MRLPVAVCAVALWIFGAATGISAEFQLAQFHPEQDADAALHACFEAVSKAGGGSVTIAPGDYHLKGAKPVALCSRTTVNAHGARFHLPETLGDRARIVVFEGTDVSDFVWSGGHFIGHCFDHRRAPTTPNTWEPNVNTRILVVHTSQGGVTERLRFEGISSERVAGAVIHVEGLAKPGSESEVATYARGVTVRDCTLVDSGKFMWDYGLLWQILVWPEEYQPADVAMAQRYFRNEVIRGPVGMSDGDDRVVFDNSRSPVAVSGIPANATDAARKSLCFYGDALPENVVRGRRYFVVESTPGFIRVSEQPGGEPLRFRGGAGPGARMMVNLQAAFFELYAPTGAGPGKGGVDIVCAKQVHVSGCNLSALGDTMHVQRCEDVVFANNHITGSRMGAFFLAEYCRNAVITGNIVDGTNGSRVISLEKSSENVTMTGNTFRNGGRGAWINQPRNLVMVGNVFLNNTTKCEPDPWRGRRTFRTGDWESYPEMYFTLHQAKGKYGPVIVRDNLFVLGPHGSSEVVTFAPGGSGIQFTGNTFVGRPGVISVDPECADAVVRDNAGVTLRTESAKAQSGNW